MWYHQKSIPLLLILSLFFSFFVILPNSALAQNNPSFEASDDELVLDDDSVANELINGAEDDDSAIPLTDTESSRNPTVEVKTVEYVKPSVSGLDFAETFDGDIFSRWKKSANKKFTGEWSHALRVKEAVIGDKGIKVMNEARHHGIATKLPKPFTNNQGKSIVLSYEAKFENNLNCGGSYLKLFDSSNLQSKGENLSDFDNETPYVIMFGPDRCGATNKVHFIIRKQNPISSEWIEHHLVDPPRVPFSTLTHVYSFTLTPDNNYTISVDGKVEKSGSMESDFAPPFTPPREIDDESDLKPEDWVDEEQIDDVNSVKPDDWDDDAPTLIDDPNAEIPEGWLSHEPKMIHDPAAQQPEDWNVEEDGDWHAPLIDNPACATAPGCGRWIVPQIANPKFKGIWTPPKIPNPAYKGPWVPRKIPNPNYYECKDPHAVANFDGIGFELWTMQDGLLFDNIVLSRNSDLVKTFIDETWKVRNSIETSQDNAATPKPLSGMTDNIGVVQKVLAGVMFFATKYPLAFGVGTAGIALMLIILVIKMFKSTTKRRDVKTKTTKQTKEGKDKAKDSEDKTHEKEGNDEDEQDDQDEEEEDDDDDNDDGATEELKEKAKSPSARQRRTKKD